MSHVVKTVASIALPVLGAVAGSFVGMPELGGALGGAISGGIVNKGGITGAITGGIGGYLGANSIVGGLNDVIGTAAGAPLVDGFGNQVVSGNAGALLAGTQAPVAATSIGSGITGALTGGGLQALGTATPAGAGAIGGAGAGSVAGSGIYGTVGEGAAPPIPGGAGIGSVASTASKGISGINPLVGIGNSLVSGANAQAATDASKQLVNADKNAIATQQPYNQFGQNAMDQITAIQADPGAYVANNPFYNSLADDAQRRLTASSASKGKLASGGTAAALQDNLLQLGTGLVNQQVNTLQTQVGTGQTAAGNTSNLQTQEGNAQAGGTVGSQNALSTGYNNQINTLLALQNLNKAPTYQPTQSLSQQ